MRKSLLILVLVPLLGSACEKKCEVPAGTYNITYKVVEGDCPPEVVEAFDGKTSEIAIEAGVCRRFSVQHNAELPNGCQLDTDMSAELSESGATAGQAAVKVNCDKPKSYTCHHLFAVEYERAP